MKSDKIKKLKGLKKFIYNKRKEKIEDEWYISSKLTFVLRWFLDMVKNKQTSSIKKVVATISYYLISPLIRLYTLTFIKGISKFIQDQDLFPEFVIEKRKESEEDVRSCYNCPKEMSFSDYMWDNTGRYKDISDDDLIDFWNDKRVGILCCSCRDKVWYRLDGNQAQSPKLRKFFEVDKKNE